MGLIRKISSDPKAVAGHRAAKAALDRNGQDDRRRGIRHETARFLELNDAVARAEKSVPWWRR